MCFDILKTNDGDLHGGHVRESDFADAMHLFAYKNAEVDSHSSSQLKLLQSKGVQMLRLVAGHGQIGDSGEVTCERINRTEVPRDKSKLWGLG